MIIVIVDCIPQHCNAAATVYEHLTSTICLNMIAIFVVCLQVYGCGI